MAERLLTTRELQDLLQLDRVTIYKMVKEGQLPALRMGGQWRFSATAIQAWLQRRDTEARTPAQPEPPAEATALQLSDLISIETLQSIQNQFAQLLGVASFTIDLEGNPYVPCSRCSAFCQLVHTTDAGMAGCRATWRKIAQAGLTDTTVHACHAGIHYAAAPVIVDGRTVGLVTAGQFLTEEPDPEAFRQSALATGDRIGVDGKALAAAGRSFEIVHEERALQITGLLATIATTLLTIGYQGYQMRQRLAQIAELSAPVGAPDPIK